MIKSVTIECNAICRKSFYDENSQSLENYLLVTHFIDDPSTPCYRNNASESSTHTHVRHIRKCLHLIWFIVSGRKAEKVKVFTPRWMEWATKQRRHNSNDLNFFSTASISLLDIIKFLVRCRLDDNGDKPSKGKNTSHPRLLWKRSNQSFSGELYNIMISLLFLCCFSHLYLNKGFALKAA